MKYKEQKNAKTGATRWVPVEGEEKSYSQKIGDLPIVGDILGPLITSSTGLAASMKTGRVEKQTMSQQKRAMELTKQARQTTDPTQKTALLDESRRLSQGAGERATEYEKTVKAGVGDYADKKSPTNFGGKIASYGPQAVRTGVAVGTLLAPGVSGIAGAPATTAAGKIAATGLTGGAVGTISGAAEGDDVSIGERTTQAKEDMILGTILGLAFGGTREAGRAVKESEVVKEMMRKTGLDKLRPTKALSSLQKQGAKNATTKFNVGKLQEDVTGLIDDTIAEGPDKIRMLKWADKIGDESVEVALDGTIKAKSSILQEMVQALKGRQSIDRSIWTKIQKPGKAKFNQFLYQAYNNQLKQVPDIVKYDKAISKYLKAKRIVVTPATILLFKKLGINIVRFFPQAGF